MPCRIGGFAYDEPAFHLEHTVVRAPIDRVEEMPCGTASHGFQFVVEGCECGMHVHADRVPIVVPDDRDVLWHAVTVHLQRTAHAARDLIVEAVHRIGHFIAFEQ